ncbi:MAG: T9SS type A sorting domain-containing protein [Ferruginibacter sp.]
MKKNNQTDLLRMFNFFFLLPLLLLITNAGFAQNDPDIPDFAQYKIDKAEFMKLRSEAIGMKRGIFPDQDFDSQKRTQAVVQMEAQRRQLLQFASPEQLNIILSAWTPIGPAPIPNGQTQTITTPVSGRVTAIAVHPTNANIVYAGTAQGGVYRTVNGGTNWVPIMDAALSLAIGSIAISPSQPETVYVGTGEPHFSSDSYFGVGVYRINNASTTATLTGPLNKDAGNGDIFSGRSIGKIIVHPTNPDIIFVSSTSGIGGIRSTSSVLPSRGIYRCNNATTANPVFNKLTGLLANLNVSVRDIAIDPLDPNILIAVPIATGANQGGIYRSANALNADPTTVTFSQRVIVNSTSTSTLNGELVGIHPTADANATFFAAMGISNGRVYRSVDGGVTWTTRITNAFCGGQCFYDIAIAADSSNTSIVYLGGDPTIVAAKSTNAGTSFTDNKVGLHVDTHVLTISPSNPTQVWLGTDGGIYKSVNSGVTWTHQNTSEFSATQFMSIAVHPTDPNFSIGGTQDNGTNFYQPGGTWTRADFGDGGYAQIDQNAPDNTNVRMYHTYFNATTLQGYGTVSTTASAGDGLWAFRGCQTAGGTTNGITCNGTINFYAPLERGPGNPNTIYYGSDRLYRSANTGTTHTVVSQNPIVSGVPISAIGISPQNDNVRIVGLNNGAIYGTSTGASPLVNLDPANTIPDAAVARTIVDPNDQNTAYVTLSVFGQNSVWKTTNLNGAPPTWTSVSTGLPQVPVNAFVVDPANSNTLFAGTDIGVYASIDAGATWFPAGTGLPIVAVFGIAMTAGNKVRIATHGKGMWEINKFTALPITYNSFTAVPKPKGVAALAWKTATESNNKGFEIERSLYKDNNQVLAWGKIGFVQGSGTTVSESSYTYNDEPSGGKKFMYRLKQLDYDGNFKYSETRLVSFSGYDYELYDAFPNPTDAGSTIKYILGADDLVNISVYSLSGKKVKELVNTQQVAGIYQVSLNTSDLATGTYIYTIKTNNYKQSKKLIIRR